jgi:hypothetical protein
MCGPYIPSDEAKEDKRSSEKVFVDMIQQDLGIKIDAQAWRMFLRCRWDRITPLAHRIHEGKI